MKVKRIIIYVLYSYTPNSIGAGKFSKTLHSVLNVAYISLEQVRKIESVIVDVRNYTESDSDNNSRIMCIPYAYLKRYYHEIPNKPLHLIVHNKVDRNLSIRFLRKKGSIFKVIVCIWIGKSIEGV